MVCLLGELGWCPPGLRVALARAGVEPNGISQRLYAVFKCNSFRGGLYPHAARLNHSCYANCQFKMLEGGRLKVTNISESLCNELSGHQVWARRTIMAGDECTISYRPDECCLPGLPWDITRGRQDVLSNYNFVCGCELCVGDHSVVESTVCSSCGNSEINGGERTRCLDCEASDNNNDSSGEDSDEITESDRVVRDMRRLQMVEQNHNKARVTKKVDWADALFEECASSVEEMSRYLHAHHLVLYRFRALMYVAAREKLTDAKTPETKADLVKVMLDALLKMDVTATLYAGKDDLMRFPIITLIQACAYPS